MPATAGTAPSTAASSNTTTVVVRRPIVGGWGEYYSYQVPASSSSSSSGTGPMVTRNVQDAAGNWHTVSEPESLGGTGASTVYVGGSVAGTAKAPTTVLNVGGATRTPITVPAPAVAPSPIIRPGALVPQSSFGVGSTPAGTLVHDRTTGMTTEQGLVGIASTSQGELFIQPDTGVMFSGTLPKSPVTTVVKGPSALEGTTGSFISPTGDSPNIPLSEQMSRSYITTDTKGAIRVQEVGAAADVMREGRLDLVLPWYKQPELDMENLWTSKKKVSLEWGAPVHVEGIPVFARDIIAGALQLGKYPVMAAEHPVESGAAILAMTLLPEVSAGVGLTLTGLSLVSSSVKDVTIPLPAPIKGVAESLMQASLGDSFVISNPFNESSRLGWAEASANPGAAIGGIALTGALFSAVQSVVGPRILGIVEGIKMSAEKIVGTDKLRAIGEERTRILTEPWVTEQGNIYQTAVSETTVNYGRKQISQGAMTFGDEYTKFGRYGTYKTSTTFPGYVEEWVPAGTVTGKSFILGEKFAVMKEMPSSTAFKVGAQWWTVETDVMPGELRPGALGQANYATHEIKIGAPAQEFYAERFELDYPRAKILSKYTGVDYRDFIGKPIIELAFSDSIYQMLPQDVSTGFGGATPSFRILTPKTTLSHEMLHAISPELSEAEVSGISQSYQVKLPDFKGLSGQPVEGVVQGFTTAKLTMPSGETVNMLLAQNNIIQPGTKGSTRSLSTILGFTDTMVERATAVGITYPRAEKMTTSQGEFSYFTDVGQIRPTGNQKPADIIMDIEIFNPFKKSTLEPITLVTTGQAQNAQIETLMYPADSMSAGGVIAEAGADKIGSLKTQIAARQTTQLITRTGQLMPYSGVASLGYSFSQDMGGTGLLEAQRTGVRTSTTRTPLFVSSQLQMVVGTQLQERLKTQIAPDKTIELGATRTVDIMVPAMRTQTLQIGRELQVEREMESQVTLTGQRSVLAQVAGQRSASQFLSLTGLSTQLQPPTTPPPIIFGTERLQDPRRRKKERSYGMKRTVQKSFTAFGNIVGGRRARTVRLV